jgi:hypothetical protein
MKLWNAAEIKERNRGQIKFSTGTSGRWRPNAPNLMIGRRRALGSGWHPVEDVVPVPVEAEVRERFGRGGEGFMLVVFYGAWIVI